jgi:hypothetical protein
MRPGWRTPSFPRWMILPARSRSSRPTERAGVRRPGG